MAEPNVARPLPMPQRRRLREIWRSAGWPCHDNVELDLLAAGLVVRVWDAAGRETLRVTDAGIRRLAAGLQHHRQVRDGHEGLVDRVAQVMQREGRLVWRGLALRAPLPGPEGATRWVQAMPDVFSIRPSTLVAGVLPIVHEIKVRRADLLSDLRRPDKGAAYCALAAQCWYVLAEGVGTADELPETFGVLQVQGDRLWCERPAPARAMQLPLATWMALARTGALPVADEAAQPPLALVDARGESGA